MSEEITINTAKLKKTYSLKGKTKINIEGELSVDYVKASGNTLTVFLTDERKFKLTNISNPNEITFYDGQTLQGFYDNFIEVVWIPDEESKVRKVVGTIFDENIDVSDYSNEKEKGLTILGGGGDDFITGTEYNDKINGGAGDDTLTGGDGNDTLTGGKGHDTFVCTSEGGIDTITDADINDTIEITDTDSESLRYAKNGKNLEIYCDGEFDPENKVIIKNYFKTKEEKRVDKLMDNNYSTEEDFISISQAIQSPIDPDNPESRINLAISGAGKINGTDNGELIIGSMKSDTIKAKGGDDTIVAGWGNDKITGGKGVNTYVFSDVEFDEENHGFGKDTVTLSSTETAILDFSSLGLGVDEYDISFVKNNLVIKTEEFGQVTIAKFKKSDVTGETGGVFLKISDEEDGLINLKELPFDYTTTKDYKGAWYSENIDATEATKGLKFTANKGNDIITLNEKIGNNTFIVKTGDGADRIVNAHKTDVIRIETSGVQLSYKKIDNDLQIFYSETDSVTIADYFPSENTINTIQIKNGKKYDEVSIKETAIINVEVTEDYEKTSNFRENLIIPKVLEDPIEVSGLKSTDKITLIDVIIPDDEDDDDNDNGDDDGDDDGNLGAPSNNVTTLTLRGENNPVFSRINDGGLIINDSIILTDFGTDEWQDFDVNYDNTHINTANAVINVTLEDFYYKATDYAEIFSGTGSIKGISINPETGDALNMNMEEIHYSRTAGSDDVIISDSENELTVVDFFNLNGAISFVDGSTSVDAIIYVDIEYSEETYVCSNYTEVITGNGSVSGMRRDKDSIQIESENITFTRENNGGLVINDSVTVVDFFDENGDIMVNEGSTQGMTLNVTLTENFNYTATAYNEVFTGNGIIKGLSENDSIVFEDDDSDSNSIEYSLTSAGLVISDGENKITVSGHTTADLTGVNVYVGGTLDDVTEKTLTIEEAPIIEISSETPFKDYAVRFEGIENFNGFNFRYTPISSQTSLFIDYQKQSSTGETEFKLMEIKNYFTSPNVVSDKAPKTFILENGEDSHSYTLEWRETLIEGTYSMFNMAESEEDYVQGVSHWIEGEGEITGVGANDVLIGSNGEDNITSGSGGAQIYGGKGNDTITGAGNPDIFFFKVGDGEDEITNANEGDSIYIGKDDEQEIKVEFVLYEQREQGGQGQEEPQGGTLKIKYGYGDNLNDVITVPFSTTSEHNIDEVYVWDGSAQRYQRQEIKNALVYGVELNQGDRYDASGIQYRQEITLNGGDIELCGLSDKVTVIMDGDDPNPQLTLSRRFSQDSKDILFINDTELKITDYFDGNEQHRKFRLSHGELPNTLSVILNDDKTVYEADNSFFETISGRGTVANLGENDVLDIDSDGRKFRRTAGSDNVTILDTDSEITVVNFFKNGDVNFADGSNSGNAVIVVDLNNQEYNPTEYQEIYTGSGSIDSIKANNGFWFQDNDANIKFALSGSGLVISDEREGTAITVKQYKSNDELIVYTGDNFDDVTIYDQTLYVSGYEQFDGTEYPFREYNITGTDKDDNLTGDEYDDVFEGGKGDDTLTGGSGQNKYIYHSGDGDDIIYGTDGAEDTLVFDEGTQVSAQYSDDNSNLLVTYSSGNSENTITISGYSATENVQWVQIGETVKSIAEYISGGGGEPQEIHITKNDVEQTYTLGQGNNTVIFDDAPMLGYGNILQSENTAGNGYTDTLDLSGISQMGEDITFTDNTLLIYGSSENGVYTNDLWLDATAFQGCPGEGDVFYKDFYSDNAPNVVITDNERSYSAKGYSTSQTNMQLANDNEDRVIAIKANGNTNNIVSNKNCNVICTFGGAGLSYEYGGGQDNVTTLDETSDNYVVDYSNDVSLNIIDWGGSNDMLTITNTNLSDMRILFNVSKNYSEEWECNSDHVIITKQINDFTDMLATSTLENAVLTDGINLKGNMETVLIGSSDVNITSWCDQIKGNVASWLTQNGYDSVYEVFYGDNPYEDDDLDTLVGYYDTPYSAGQG